MEINTILNNLKILGSLNVNDKIYLNSNNEFKIEKANILRPLSRFIYNNDRNDTFNNINILIEKIIILIKNFIKIHINHVDIINYNLINSDIDVSNYLSILKELRISTIGLNNLKITYKKDKEFTDNITFLIEKINLLIFNIDNEYYCNIIK